MSKFAENEPLGIMDEDVRYIKTLPNQNSAKEANKIKRFLTKLISSKILPEFSLKNIKIQFINYGDTELVYVLKAGNKKYTILVGQPITEFGIVKNEYNNLKKLHKEHPDIVINPICYYSNNKRELYITPYLYQARCIASSNEGWGIYVPEPDYHFKVFTKDEREVINSSMIALLIALYDEKNKSGIASCKIGGGDFVLEKGFEEESITHENILKRMKLIAARQFVNMELNEYIETIRREFSKSTYYTYEDESHISKEFKSIINLLGFQTVRDKNIIINYKSRLPMTQEEIEQGIELGLKIRDERKKEFAKNEHEYK